jgi:hypothetical protein
MSVLAALPAAELLRDDDAIDRMAQRLLDEISIATPGVIRLSGPHQARDLVREMLKMAADPSARQTYGYPEEDE